MTLCKCVVCDKLLCVSDYTSQTETVNPGSTNSLARSLAFETVKSHSRSVQSARRSQPVNVLYYVVCNTLQFEHKKSQVNIVDRYSFFISSIYDNIILFIFIQYINTTRVDSYRSYVVKLSFNSTKCVSPIDTIIMCCVMDVTSSNYYLFLQFIIYKQFLSRCLSTKFEKFQLPTAVCIKFNLICTIYRIDFMIVESDYIVLHELILARKRKKKRNAGQRSHVRRCPTEHIYYS